MINRATGEKKVNFLRILTLSLSPLEEEEEEEVE